MPLLTPPRTWPRRFGGPLAFALGAMVAGLACSEPSDERRLDIEIREPQPPRTADEERQPAGSGGSAAGEPGSSPTAQAHGAGEIASEEAAAPPAASPGEALAGDTPSKQ